jgi:LmbE family N-acetylglucosaminyl deacetylase
MDDEVLGCGGAIAKHVAAGDEVAVWIVCHRVYERQYNAEANEAERANTRRAQYILGYQTLEFLDLPDERLHMHFQELLDGLERAVATCRPAVAYVPHGGDLHQDHRTVAHGSNIALRALSAHAPQRVLAYEVPSSTDQVFPNTATLFVPNVFMDIEAHLERKLAAMAAYERESRHAPHPRSAEMLRARAHVYGTQCQRAAAEAFMLLRETT